MAAAEGAVGALRHPVSPSSHSAGPATCQLTSERGGRSLEDEHSAIKHISVAVDRKKNGGRENQSGQRVASHCADTAVQCRGKCVWRGGDYLGANSGLCC